MYVYRYTLVSNWVWYGLYLYLFVQEPFHQISALLYSPEKGKR
jgi:hypothetical protein